MRGLIKLPNFDNTFLMVYRIINPSVQKQLPTKPLREQLTATY